MNKLAITFLLIILSIIGYKFYKNYLATTNQGTQLANLSVFDLDIKIIAAQTKRAEPPIQPPTDLGIYRNHIVQQVYTCFILTCPSGGNYIVEYKGVTNEQDCNDLQGKPVMNLDPNPVYQGCAVGK